MNISRPKCLIGAVEETCPSQIASRVRKMAFDFLNELFDLLGNADPLVARSRRDLATALF